MSMGSRSIVYAPISRQGLAYVIEQYPAVSKEQIEALYEILTNRLTTETLLFVSLVELLDQYIQNGYAEIKLSALRTDQTGKVQTYTMELLHDVVVELQMAGRAMQKIQDELRRCGCTLVFMHSCKAALVPIDAVSTWYDAQAEEEATRTLLDWEGTFEKGASEEYVIANAHYNENEARNAMRCYSIALGAVERAGLAVKEGVLKR